jgi:phosphoesterase RecJ-like protein
MLACKELFHALNPTGKVTLACDDISRIAVRVTEYFYPTFEVVTSINTEHDLIILVDANSRSQLGPKLEMVTTSPAKTLVIDHHEENPEIHGLAEHTLVRSDRFSTCEILTDLYQDLAVPIQGPIASLLLAGLLFDTRRFFYADRNTLNVALHLIDAGADYDTCLEALVIRPDKSERMARLKAAGRLKIHSIDNWLVVTSKIGAYEASACRGLIELGADVAIVGGTPSKGVVRLSARSTSQFHRETGVNLSSDVMEQLGELIHGEGGGHANAAGANGTQNRDEALERSVELIRETITKHSNQNGS